MLRRIGYIIGGILVVFIVADLLGFAHITPGGRITLQTRALSEARVDSTQGAAVVVDNMGSRTVRNVRVLCTQTDPTGRVTQSSYFMLNRAVAPHSQSPLPGASGANNCAVIDLNVGGK